MGTTYDVFLSHNSDDKPLVEELALGLQDEAGLNPWLDAWHIPGGAQWEAEIERALGSCRTCAVILGEHGWGEYHLRESKAALARREEHPSFRMIPIFLPGAREEDTDELPALFAEIQWIDFREGLDDADALARLIAAIGGEAPYPEGRPNLSYLIRRDARRWERTKREDESLLYRGDELRRGQQWASQHPDEMNILAWEFLQAGASVEEQQRVAQEKRRQRIILGLVVGLIVTVALALLAWRQRNVAQEAQATAVGEANTRATAQAQAEHSQATAVAEADIRATAQAQADARRKEAEVAQAKAEEQRQIALSRQLAAQSASELDDNNYDTALLLAIEAGRIAHTAEAYGAIRQTLANPWRTAAILPGHTGSVQMAAWNADGSQMLTVDGTVRVWEARTGVKLLDLSSHAITILQAVWNADGSRILTAGCDRRNESNSECLEGTARVWDAKTGDELLTFSGHTDRVVQASWNADESRVLTVGEDGTARVWDVETGVKLLDLSSHGVAIWQAVWNADGSRILTTGDDDKARVYNAETGAELLTLTGGVAVWNADGSRILTAGDDGKARVWDAKTGDELLTLSGHTDRVVQASWNADESRILTASRDGTARVWEADTGDQILYLPQYMLRVDQAVWNRDESLILVTGCVQYYPTVFGCQVKMARVWNAETGAELLALTGEDSAASYAKWSPDGTHILTIDNRDVVRIWNVAGRDTLTLTGHAGTVRYATWNTDGSRILTAGDDGTARLWDLGASYELPILGGYADRVTRAVWNADESLILTTSWDLDENLNIVGTARVWDAKTGDELLTLSGHSGEIDLASWNADESRILTASALDGTTRLWDAETGVELLTLTGGTAAWNPSKTRILTVYVSAASVWNATTGAKLHSLSGHWYSINQALWSADGTRILTTSLGDDETRLWNARTGAPRFVFPGGIAAWNDDGTRILTCLADGRIALWDTRDVSSKPFALFSNLDRVRQAIWNTDGSRILVITDSGVKVLDTEPGGELLDFSGRTSEVTLASWSPDESRVLSVDRGGTARVWDAETGAELLTLTGGVAAWNVDGSRILTAGDDGKARVWDAKTGDELLALSGHTDRLVQASWNADESRILTVSWDGTIRQWYIRMDDLLAEACRRAWRNMTQGEWQRFMSDEGYRKTCPGLPVPEE